MTTELAPHRLHLNLMPVLAAPGIAIAGFLLDGPATAFYGVALWCAVIVGATIAGVFRYMKHRSHISWPLVSSVGCMEDPVPR